MVITQTGLKIKVRILRLKFVYPAIDASLNISSCKCDHTSHEYSDDAIHVMQIHCDDFV